VNNVTLSNVANGNYPIWSSLRLVNLGSAASDGVANLATTSQNFVPVGDGGRPDYVPADQLHVVHSHFDPPGVNYLPTTGTAAKPLVSNGSASIGANCSATEAGGDVGGQIFDVTSENNLCPVAGVGTGNVGDRF